MLYHRPFLCLKIRDINIVQILGAGTCYRPLFYGLKREFISYQTSELSDGRQDFISKRRFHSPSW